MNIQDSQQTALFDIPAAAHDPGGKTMMPLPPDVRGDWVISPDEMYRYELLREWDENLPVLMAVGMNPSTANPRFDDPTLYKERRYAIAWNFGTLLMGNAFAYRATDQKRLMDVSDPVGQDNDKHLLTMAERADMILLAYDSPHKSLRWRGLEVARLLAKKHAHKLHVLELSKDEIPKHPLYLKGTLKPFPWMPAL
jgi:hypothetical protein